MRPLSHTYSILTTAFALLAATYFAFAQEQGDDQPPQAVPPLQETTPKSPLDGLQQQPGDEELRTFQPKDPAADVEKQKAEAKARYMAGRIQEERSRNEEALESYLEAIKLDPQAMNAYESAIPLLIQFRRSDEAADLSLKAAQSSEQGFDLVIVVAVNMYAQSREVDASVALIEKAQKLGTLQPESVKSLMLKRRLGELFDVAEKVPEAAREFETLFTQLTSGKFTADEVKEILTEPGPMYDLFGETFLKNNQPDLALKAFTEASKFREERPGLHSYNLALIFQKTGKPEDALKSLQEYFDAQLQNRGRAAYVLLKDLLAAVGREDTLLAQLEALREKDRRNDPLRYFLADEYLARGEFAKAEPLYTNGARNITDPRAVIGLFAITRRDNQPERLLENGSKIFQLFNGELRPTDQEGFEQSPEDVKYLAEKFETELDALLKDEPAMNGLFAHAKSLRDKDEPELEFAEAWFLGNLAAEAERTPDVAGYYKFAISMRNDPPAALYRELGAYLLDHDEERQAVDVFNEAINHSSGGLVENRWMFMYYLSYAHVSLKEVDKALEIIHRAQELQPGIPDLFFQEGWILTQAKKFPEALEVFDRVIAKNSQDKSMVNRCRFVISAIYVEQGEKEKGEQVLVEILDEDPDNTQANNDLGYLWADQGKNLERSETMIRKALEDEPENPAYLDSLGWVLFKQEKYEAAAEFLKKATEQKNGDDSTIHDHLGDTYEKLNRPEDAQSSWKKARELEQKDAHPDEKLLEALKGKIKE